MNIEEKIKFILDNANGYSAIEIKNVSTKETIVMKIDEVHNIDYDFTYMIDCRNCIDCIDCRFCSYCRNCSDCIGCRNCRNCIDCSDCNGLVGKTCYIDNNIGSLTDFLLLKCTQGEKK